MDDVGRVNLTFRLPLGQVQVLYYAKNYFQINDKVKTGNQIRPFPGAPAPHFFFFILLGDTLVLHTCPSPLELIGAALFLQLHTGAPD